LAFHSFEPTWPFVPFSDRDGIAGAAHFSFIRSEIDAERQGFGEAWIDCLCDDYYTVNDDGKPS
jgi:hypothetical protein